MFLKRLSFFLFALCIICPLYAGPQGLDSGQGSLVPSPEEDYLQSVRKHLDNIRSSEKRPTVALVLSGGGAKGAAQVGAIKYIEETGIPIDFVCGTSIGAMVGGLYSVGYDSAMLDSLFRNQDWSELLTDKVDPKYVPINMKRHKSKYQLNVPFNFGQKVLSGAEDDGENTASLMSSLPGGYVNGLHINNLFSAMTVGYHDSLSFATLPIPFCCVATDLVSCEAKYWENGALRTAIRSSIGIPGLFKPVRTEDMILSDGGTRNNFPVDIAKKVGADIIIGIDLHDPLLTYDEINNIGTIFEQFVNMLVRNSYEQQIEQTDVFIKPELNGYTSMSFNPEAVELLISNGYSAALEHSGALAAIKTKTGDAVTKYYNRKAVNLYETDVSLSEISFSGLSQNDSKVLSERIDLNVSRKINARDIEEAVQIIKGTGAVESVTYSLYGTEEPYRLVFNCVPAPNNRLSAGARIDTETWAEVALDLGLNSNRLSGPKLDVNLKLGMSQRADVRFTLDYYNLPTLNFEASVANINGYLQKSKDDYFESATMNYDSRYVYHEEKVFLSSNKWYDFDGQVGLRYKGYLTVKNHMFSTLLPFDNQKGNYLGFFLKGDYYSIDDEYFPSRGIDLRFGADVDIMKSRVKSFEPVTTLALDFRSVIPCGDIFSIIPDVHYRSVFDKFNSVPFRKYDSITVPEFSYAHRLFLGGDIQGRYIENQIPFIGFNAITDCTKIVEDVPSSYKIVSYDHLAVLNLDFRTRLYEDLYLSVLGGFARMSTTLLEFFGTENVQSYCGAGLQLSYDSVVGPIKGSVNWSNRVGNFKNDIGFYLSIGFVL